MKRYPIRVIKYAVQLSILLIVIYAAMNAIGYSTMPVQTLWETTRGLTLLAVVIFFALLYPFFGFAKRQLSFDTSKHVDTVDKAMHMGGFNRINDDPTNLVYRAATPTKRLLMLGEDTITVSTKDGVSTIEGMRKDTVKAYLRMDIYLQK